MTWQAAAIPVVVAIVSVIALNDRRRLRRAHARPLTHWLNALRWFVGVASWCAIGVAGRQPVLVVCLAGVTGASLLLPCRLLLAAGGGRELRWELYHLQREAALLESRYRGGRPPRATARMEQLLERMARVRTDDTAEYCELLGVTYRDWIAGIYSPLEHGRRTIRIHELEVELYGDAAREAELTPAVAQDRWELYRTFATLGDWGGMPRGPEQRREFAGLVDELSRFRTSETAAFIDAVQASAREWLESREPQPWPPDGGVDGLGLEIAAEYRRLWPRNSVFWGARLGREDRDALSLHAPG